jgi:PAS domain S-box-containing protein
MSKAIRSILLRYGLAVLAVTLALLLTLWLWPLLERSMFAVFLMAVLASAVYGGLGPWLLATILSVLAISYFFMPPLHSLAINSWQDIVRLGLFGLGALLILIFSEARKRAGETARRQREWLQVTLSSIGDAVMATDQRGYVIFMNPVAEALTGWKQAEALGKSLAEVFDIINEETRKSVENPVTRVLREGAVVGLANHTVLIAKDGTEIPIDDSGAPIKDSNGVNIGVVLVFHDITERRRTEAVRAQWAALVESSDDAIIGKTLDGIITSWNSGAERLYGYSAEEVLGQPISILVPPDHQDELPEILGRLQRGERVDHYETRRVRKDGQLVTISVTISPIKDATGKITGASAIARDITERRRVEEAHAELLAREQEARKRAEEASRLKDEFLAMISHELRTPLTAMLGWARMLRTSQLDEATTARALETIERNAKSQAQLVEDLLDVSRITSGKLRLNARSVELAPIIEAAVDAAHPGAKAKDIRIQRVLNSDVGVVFGDPDRLQQVVWNLLSNAIKFTPKGGRVQVRLTRINSHVEITVSDTGAGIRPEFLPYIFDRFRQADSTITRAHGGLGLGLAIVRHIVELHGGTVRAESPGVGQGATFTVQLPIMVVHARGETDPSLPAYLAPAADVSMDRLPMLNGLEVLVVDDEADTRDLLTTVLERCDAKVVAVASAAEALEALRWLKPDVLVSDIGMPDEDGYALIRKVRALPPEQGGRIPAVALTAHARVEDRMRALSAGYQMHVAKPVEPTELVTIIASLVGRTPG